MKERYQGKDKQRIWFLRSELSKVQYQGEDMSDFISKLQKLLNQLLSAGCTAYEDDDKIFLLLNTLPMEYHPFKTSITNAESLTFEEVSSRLILEHEKLAGEKAASRRGVAFYTENRKPSKVLKINGVGTAPRPLAATATSRDTWRRTVRRGLPRRIEGARGLPTQGRLLLGWPW